MEKLYVILPLALILCLTVGCRDKADMAELEEFKAQESVEEQNKTLVMRYFGALESGDLEAVKEIFSPDCILHHTTRQDLSLEETIETVKKQNEQALTKLVYLAVMEAAKKWTMRHRDWAMIYSQLMIFFEDRLGKYV